MGTEVIALGMSFLASVIAFGVFMWRAFVKMFEQFGARIDQQFANLDGKFQDRFETLDRKIDDRFEILDRRIDDKIQPIEAKVDRLDGKVDELAKDHQSLSRQLAEFRGEVRGRLGELAPPGPRQSPA
jgi:predicted  nucleic acid-binding Zn-ribbon protein